MTKTLKAISIPAIWVAISLFLLVGFPSGCSVHARTFDGKRAYQDVQFQESLGPRTPGSDAHAQLIEWLSEELTTAGWSVELQEITVQGQTVQNVIAKRGSESDPWIILGAHYDSRFVADQDTDPNLASLPVPGANDGASGVAVLLELARSLPSDLNKQVWLVFFDAEDQGHIDGWDWILGSTGFVQNLEGKPDAAVIIDMIGDADLNLYYEQNSDSAISAEIWQAASEAGYADQFIQEARYSILDDHIPFIEAGIPAVDIIDFDYPYWHTSQDTSDKVSADSLEAVGVTLFHWLLVP